MLSILTYGSVPPEPVVCHQILNLVQSEHNHKLLFDDCPSPPVVITVNVCPYLIVQGWQPMTQCNP